MCNLAFMGRIGIFGPELLLCTQLCIYLNMCAYHVCVSIHLFTYNAHVETLKTPKFYSNILNFIEGFAV